MPDKSLKWIIFLIPLLLVLIFTKKDVGSPNDAARMATIQAMVEQHTMALDHAILKSDVDIMMRNGHRYSDKPPLLQGMGALVYWPFYQVGIDISNHYGFIYYLLTFLLSGIPFVFLCGLSYAILDKVTHNKVIAWAGWGIMLTGTIILPYAMTFNNHLMAALMILVAVGMYLSLDKQTLKKSLWVAGIGTFASLGIYLELPTGGLTFLGLGFLIGKKEPKYLWSYLGGAILPSVAHFSLNYWQTGDLVPAYLHKEFYQFNGSYWGGALGKKRLFGNSVAGQFFHMTLGYRGIFLFSPILLGGLWEMIQRSVKKEDIWRKPAVLGLILLFGTMASYAVQISDLGGGSYGLRWVIPALPLLILFTAFWIGRVFTPKKGVAGVGLLMVPSIIIAWIGVYNPWPQNAVTPIPFLENLSYMTFQGNNLSNPLAEFIAEKTSLDKGLAYYEMGREAWKQGNLNTAIAYMQKSLSRNPGHTLTYYQLGLLYDITGNPEKAFPVYEKLISLEPDNPGTYHNYAVALVHAKQYKKAEEMYKKALQLEPNRITSIIGLAGVLFLQERYPEAMAQIQIVLKTYPNSQSAQILYNQINLFLNP